MLIVLEGIDGCGKSTVAGLLETALSPRHSVSLFRFPGYDRTAYGGMVREYLQGEYGEVVHPKLAFLPYALDRFAVRADIESAIQMDDIVICDRFVPSNVAHQAAKVGGDEDRFKLGRFIETAEYTLFGLPVPDLVFVFDIGVDAAMRRLASRKPAWQGRDLHEENRQYLTSVRSVYVSYPFRCGMLRVLPVWDAMCPARGDSLGQLSDQDGSGEHRMFTPDEMCSSVLRIIQESM